MMVKECYLGTEWACVFFHQRVEKIREETSHFRVDAGVAADAEGSGFRITLEEPKLYLAWRALDLLRLD
jgi:hypothetical protein